MSSPHTKSGDFSQPNRSWHVPPGMGHILALEDLEAAARRYIPRPIFGYVSGGVETNTSLRGNRSVFDDIGFVPRVLVDVQNRSTETTLFGRRYAAPFGFAPMGGTAMAAYQGDLVLARTAKAVNVPMVLSGAALTPLEQVRKESDHAWFQAYLPGDDATITELVQRVERAGYDTLALTVDVAVAANRENNVRSGFHTPLRPSLRLAWDGIVRPRWLFGMFFRTLVKHGMPHFENMGPRVPLLSRTGERGRGPRDQLSWKHLELMRRLWKGKLLVKGVLHKADVRIARESGADGIFVSNHGGRQLDGAISAIRALPRVVDAVGDRADVILDGGVRRGSDVVKALCLGARACMIGRAWLYGLAAGGQAGVERSLDILLQEIDVAMALLGRPTLADLSRDCLDSA